MNGRLDTTAAVPDHDVGGQQAETVTRSPEVGTFSSRSGVTVTLQRIPQPDCPYGSQQWQVQYGAVNRPGTVAWFPDVPRCWPLVHQVAEWFRDDRDNLGRVFGRRLRRPCEACPADRAARD